MDISKNGLALIESFEGYSFNAYWDAFGHVWTVGYGETQGVTSSTTMTRAQAQADLEHRVVREYEPAIKALGVKLNQNQFDALCSFVWNLGPGSMAWDVGRYVRQREFKQAANAMLQYDRAGGVVLAGLVRRRQTEAALFLKPAVDPYAMFDHVPRAFTRKWLESTPQLAAARRAGLLRSFGGDTLTVTERKVVEQYDTLPHHERWERRKRQLWMMVLRYRIAYAAQHEPNGWDKWLRHRRWQAMWERDKVLA